MSKRVQYAQSFPELTSAPTQEPGRHVFYAKADGLYYRKADGTEVGPLGSGGAGSAPANMVTTDTDQTISSAKTFGPVEPTGWSGSQPLRFRSRSLDDPANPVLHDVTLTANYNFEFTQPNPDAYFGFRHSDNYFDGAVDIMPGDGTVNISPKTPPLGDTYGARLALSALRRELVTDENGTSETTRSAFQSIHAGMDAGGQGFLRTSGPLYENTDRVLTTATGVTTDTVQTITGEKTFQNYFFVSHPTSVYRATEVGAGYVSIDTAVGATFPAEVQFTVDNLAGVGALFARRKGTTSGIELDTRNADLYERGNRVYSAGNLPPAPSNMVTTDTVQTITGEKTFTGYVSATGPTEGNVGFSAMTSLGGGLDLSPSVLQLSPDDTTASNSANSSGFTFRHNQWINSASQTFTVYAQTYHDGSDPDGPVALDITDLRVAGSRVLTKASTLPTPTNMVTTDTDQTITGEKVFTGPVEVGDPSSEGAWSQLAPNSLIVAPGATSAGTTGAATSVQLNRRYWANDQDNWAESVNLRIGGAGPTSQLDVDRPIYEMGNRVYSAGNLPPAPTNMVTTDTAQTITGQKTFNSNLTVAGNFLSVWDGANGEGVLTNYGYLGLYASKPQTGYNYAELDLTARHADGSQATVFLRGHYDAANVARLQVTAPIYENDNRVLTSVGTVDGGTP